ncbi:type II toxin-antitoxin system RelE/ParE family toxin [Campylobacter fetus subsp. venerealis]|uniref:type II toxin-antitoxin system RelE/ParE family toxin n=1 Tax=Campylobacter fetus TaxID=196 RepID=UPI0008189B2F|nr:type II toxin-antitoxin system RelE/ParE family toxin [Campylobacter fetus]MBK3498181.1 type II toxin-antitoxin system RelE/ParE family toxin [Campylobacter fetus subsp. venerealis]MBK3502187.1 type II toxin-antitoxin system RelE/ParE family toxin [Campylobacter fetus subsp. venerealis]OCS16817.1 plasmid stabilization system [Campylobacter fetus subsp. venerealis]
MQIIYSDKFNKRTDDIISYIWQDSPKRALKFYDDLMLQIKNLTFMPYSYRRSITANDDRVRDLIFKKYVIVFLINKENDTIEILNIYSRNLP